MLEKMTGLACLDFNVVRLIDSFKKNIDNM